jgi:hypothetical protein
VTSTSRQRQGFPRNGDIRVSIWAAPGRIFIAAALSPAKWLLLRRVAGESEPELSQAERDCLAPRASAALEQAVAARCNQESV